MRKARRVIDGVRDRCERRHDRDLASALNTVWVLIVRHLNDDRGDLWQITGDGDPVVEEPSVINVAVLGIDVFFVERPADALHNAALDLPFDIVRDGSHGPHPGMR